MLLKDQHAGYITWSEFERNQRVIADNATGKGALARGAVRRGELLRLGFCAVVIAVARCMWAMAVRPGATIAKARL